MAGAQWHLAVDAAWLAQLKPGDRIDLVDARDAQRRLSVTDCSETGALVEPPGPPTSPPRRSCVCASSGGAARAKAWCPALRQPQGFSPCTAGTGCISCAKGSAAQRGDASPNPRRSHARCLRRLRRLRAAIASGLEQRRIGGVVRRRIRSGAEIEITVARDGGEPLRADKGINLPDTDLRLPALTDKDLEDLAVVAQHADLVGLSFAQSADNVRMLRRRSCATSARRIWG